MAEALTFTINVITAFNPKTLGTGVGIVIGDRKPEYMSTAEARLLAMNLIGCADAADAEAIFAGYLSETQGLGGHEIDAAIKDWRTLRHARMTAAAQAAEQT